jgi:hypothetical protein
VQDVSNLALLRCEFQRRGKIPQGVVEPLLVRGNLPQGQVAMCGLLRVFARLDETFEQFRRGVDLVDATIKPDNKKHPTKIILIRAAVFQPLQQQSLGIGG